MGLASLKAFFVWHCVLFLTWLTLNPDPPASATHVLELEESPRCLVFATLYIRELGLGALKEKVATNSVWFCNTLEHNIFQPS